MCTCGQVHHHNWYVTFLTQNVPQNLALDLALGLLFFRRVFVLRFFAPPSCPGFGPRRGPKRNKKHQVVFADVEKHTVHHCREHRADCDPSSSLQRDERCKRSPKKSYKLWSLCGNLQQSIVRFTPLVQSLIFSRTLKSRASAKCVLPARKYKGRAAEQKDTTQLVRHRTTIPAVPHKKTKDFHAVSLTSSMFRLFALFSKCFQATRAQKL